MRLSPWLAAPLALLVAACAPKPYNQGPWPTARQGLHDQAIRKQLDTAPLARCELSSIPLGELRELTPIAAPVTMRIPVTYEHRLTISSHEVVRGLDGRQQRGWEWKEELSVPHGDVWYDTRPAGKELAEYLFLVRPASGYMPFGPGTRWKAGDLRECGDWAGDRPVRVLLFTLHGPGDSVFHAASAYWRGHRGDRWVSFLGLGSSPMAQAEFLTLIRTSR